MSFAARGRLTFVALLVLAAATVATADRRAPAVFSQLRTIEVNEPDGQILSYRHLAGSTEVQMRGTRLARAARVKLKIGSRPGFVELDINRGGITGLEPATRLGQDFLTYVLWAVSVDGRASNLGEITFENGQPVAVNLTTPYQTFWLMVTAEPNYAVVDPSAEVVLYSVKQTAGEAKALAIDGDLFFFTHYASYESAPGEPADRVPNQLLQARKALELASRSNLLTAGPGRAGLKEEQYTRLALAQAETFLKRAEDAYVRNPKGQEVIQFARTAAQSAENARALAMGAVGGLQVRQLENEAARLRDELAGLKRGEPAVLSSPPAPAESLDEPAPAPNAAAEPVRPAPLVVSPPLAKQPALWFAVAGWTLAIVLLFRRRSV